MLPPDFWSYVVTGLITAPAIGAFAHHLIFAKPESEESSATPVLEFTAPTLVERQTSKVISIKRAA